MQTSAPPTFAQYVGTLRHSAQARTKVIDGEGHVVPVLCLDLELDNAHHTQMHVEQPYPAGQHTLAQAAALKLKAGMRVTVVAPLVGMQLIANNTAHVHLVPEPTTTDLFQEPSQ